MTEPHPFIARLDSDAQGAEAAEAEFRRTMKERVAALARERAFAYRRANLMRALFGTLAQAENSQIAVAGAIAALRNRLGWVDASPARDEVLAEYAKVADAALRALAGGGPAALAGDEAGRAPSDTADGQPLHVAEFASDAAHAGRSSPGEPRDGGPDVAAALADFERWYEAARGKPFWVLFEHYMPETQLVDF